MIAGAALFVAIVLWAARRLTGSSQKSRRPRRERDEWDDDNED